MSQDLEADSKLRIETLKTIPPRDYELWKYYEDRADRLGERLWSIGLWLMTIVVGTVSIPFSAKFVESTVGVIPVKVVSPLPVAVLSLFGMFLCFLDM